MKNSEHLLEEVLSGLKSVEAPPDMERRILGKLQDHASASSAKSSRLQSWLPSWLAEHTRPIAISAACGISALLVVLMIPAVHHTGHATAPSTSSAQSALPTPQSPPTEMTADATTQTPDPAPIARRTVAHHLNRATPASAEDDLAEVEMRAPSRPAPPMPLTDQEKLLLRLVHTNDPVELALLDSKTWAAQFTRSKAQFDKFFAPPKTAPTGDQQ